MQLRHFDRNEFISCEDKTLFSDACIFEFFNNIRHKADWRTNILNHFHFSTSENQIQPVVQYFRHFISYFPIAEFVDGMHFDNVFYFYHQPKEEIITHRAVVSIEMDPIWEEYRIVGIRLLEDKRWKIKKCIFKVEDAAKLRFHPRYYKK